MIKAYIKQLWMVGVLTMGVQAYGDELVDAEGRALIEFQTQTVQTDYGTRSIVGMMDMQGQIIVPAKYHKIVSHIGEDGTTQLVGIYNKPDDDRHEWADYYTNQGEFIRGGVNDTFVNYREYQIDITQELDDKALEALFSDRALASEESSSFEERFAYHILLNQYASLINNKTKSATPLKGATILRISRDRSPGMKKQGLMAAQDFEGNWGIINEQAQWVVAPQPITINNGRLIETLPESILAVYDSYHEQMPMSCQGFIFVDGTTASGFYDLEEFNKGEILAKACIAKDEQYQYGAGILNDKGDWVIAPQKDRSILALPDDQGYVLFQDNATEKIGYINRQGEVVIEANFYIPSSKEFNFNHAFEQGFGFDEHGLLPVSLEKNSPLYGFINRQGQFVIFPKLITNQSNSYRFDRYGLTYTNIPNTPKQDHSFQELLKETEFAEMVRLLNSLSGRRVVDMTGKDIFEGIEGSFYSFDDKGYAVYTNNQNMGLIDLTGKVVIAPNYNSLETHDGFIIASVSMPDESEERVTSYGIIDYQDAVQLTFEYESIQAYDDFILVKHRDGRYGVLDNHLKWQIPLQPYPLLVPKERYSFRVAGFY